MPWWADGEYDAAEADRSVTTKLIFAITPSWQLSSLSICVKWLCCSLLSKLVPANTPKDNAGKYYEYMCQYGHNTCMQG